MNNSDSDDTPQNGLGSQEEPSLSAESGPVLEEPEILAALADSSYMETFRAEGRAAVIEDQDEYCEHLDWLDCQSDRLSDFALRIGVADSLLGKIAELESFHRFELHGLFFWDSDEQDLLPVRWRRPVDSRNFFVKYGAAYISRLSESFSEQWYLAQIYLTIIKCYEARGDERTRLALNVGKLISEAHWRAQTADSLFRSVAEGQRRMRAGRGGGGVSSARRLERLEGLMLEIEKLASLVPHMSEERILAQAWDNLAARRDDVPASPSIRRDYQVAVKCDPPFRDRYARVFAKNA